MQAEPYGIRLHSKAQKDLKDLRPHIDRALREIYRLRLDPHAGEPKKGSLRGVRALGFFLPGRGEYRALYVFHPSERECIVFMVGAHEGLYERAVRRFDALQRTGSLD
jgi:mRNA-degrading endonuclease RelE of RelBE toxin-antitoxin system